MNTERMVIDFPGDMPLGILHKALAEAARQYGMRLAFERTQVPRGTYFELVPAYRAEQPKGAA